MIVTLKDVAAHSGFSVQTVSHILGTRGALYRAETRQKVKAAANDLGYRPNAAAQSIRKGRFGNLILLMSSDPERSGLFPSLLNGINDVLDLHQLHLTISRLPDEKLTNEKFMPSVLRKWMGDGLLILYNSQIPDRLIALLDRFKIPAVWINADRTYDSVYPDEFLGAHLATQRLLKAQPGPVYFADFTYGIKNLNRHYSARDRYEGYTRAMTEAGRKPVRIGEEDNVPRSDRLPYMTRWLARQTMPFGALCISESTAFPLCYAAAMKRLKLGRDLSVITFGQSLTNILGVELDTVVVPMHEMGSKAVQVLLEKIEKPRRRKGIALPMPYIEGTSVARLPG